MVNPSSGRAMSRNHYWEFFHRSLFVFLGLSAMSVSPNSFKVFFFFSFLWLCTHRMQRWTRLEKHLFFFFLWRAELRRFCARARQSFISFMVSILLCGKRDAKTSSDGCWLLAIDVLWGIDVVGNCDGGDTFDQDGGTGR